MICGFNLLSLYFNFLWIYSGLAVQFGLDTRPLTLKVFFTAADILVLLRTLWDRAFDVVLRRDCLKDSYSYVPNISPRKRRSSVDSRPKTGPLPDHAMGSI
jgi:hypothetical protein